MPNPPGRGGRRGPESSGVSVPGPPKNPLVGAWAAVYRRRGPLAPPVPPFLPKVPAMSRPSVILAAVLALAAVGTVGAALAGGPAPCDKTTGLNC